MAAHGQRALSDDPDLAVVVEAWSSLPTAVRAAIVKLARGGR